MSRRLCMLADPELIAQALRLPPSVRILEINLKRHDRSALLTLESPEFPDVAEPPVLAVVIHREPAKLIWRFDELALEAKGE